MAKSTFFLWFVVTIGVAAVLAVLALGQETSAPPPQRGGDGGGGASASSDVSVAADSASALVSFKALRETEVSLLQDVLRQTPSHRAISGWLNPSLAVRPRFSMPRPDQPPQPFPSLDRPDASRLEAGARARLDALVATERAGIPALTGVAVLVVEGGAIRQTLANEGAEAPAVLTEWLKASGAEVTDLDAVAALEGGALVEIIGAATKGGVWTVAWRPLDAARLDAYAQALGKGRSIALQLGDAVVMSASGAPKLDGLGALGLEAGASSKARTLGAASVSALGQATLTEGTSAAWVVSEAARSVSVAASGGSSSKAPAPGGGESSVPLGERIKNSPLLGSPTEHLPVLGALLVALIVFTLLGWLLMRSDVQARWRTLARKLEDRAQPIESLKLPNHELALVEAALSRVPAPAPVKAAAPHDTGRERALQSENARLKSEMESFQATIKQSQKQLDYARGRISEVETERDQATQVQRQLRNEVTNLQQQLGGLEQSLQHAQAAAAVAASSPVSSSSMSSAPPPVRRSSSSASTAPPSRQRDYDTEEVSGEDMSQLLEGLDIEGSTAGSLTAMAEQIDAMSREQAQQKMSTSSGPTDAVRARRQDPTKITATGLPNFSKNIPHFPTPHQPMQESDIWASRNDTDVDMEAARTETFDRPSFGFDEAGGDHTVDGDLGAEFANALASATRGDRSSRKSLTSPSKALSPAGLLEALKRRGQQESALEASEGNPSTRVAPIAQELLDQSRAIEKPQTLSHSGTFRITGSRADHDPTTDSEYFKTLYEEFLDTKRSCGESTDNITLERFVNRLARNKQALMDRYSCRTVRFQVYVKDGRAALKATPVK